MSVVKKVSHTLCMFCIQVSSSPANTLMLSFGAIADTEKSHR